MSCLGGCSPSSSSVRSLARASSPSRCTSADSMVAGHPDVYRHHRAEQHLPPGDVCGPHALPRAALSGARRELSLRWVEGDPRQDGCPSLSLRDNVRLHQLPRPHHHERDVRDARVPPRGHRRRSVGYPSPSASCARSATSPSSRSCPSPRSLVCLVLIHVRELARPAGSHGDAILLPPLDAVDSLTSIGGFFFASGGGQCAFFEYLTEMERPSDYPEDAAATSPRPLLALLRLRRHHVPALREQGARLPDGYPTLRFVSTPGQHALLLPHHRLTHHP